MVQERKCTQHHGQEALIDACKKDELDERRLKYEVHGIQRCMISHGGAVGQHVYVRSKLVALIVSIAVISSKEHQFSHDTLSWSWPQGTHLRVSVE